MEHATALAVVGYCITLALVNEVASYLLVYRGAAFQNLKRHAKKLDEAASATGAKNLKKRQARLDAWKEDAAKQMVTINYKTGFLSMVLLFSGFKMLNRLFGGQVVARLPFEPPAFLQKATHRGLEGADPTECGALFIYMLCQASLRPMVSKLLGWGPSRTMTELKPTLPKSMQFDMFKDK